MKEDWEDWYVFWNRNLFYSPKHFTFWRELKIKNMKVALGFLLVTFMVSNQVSAQSLEQGSQRFHGVGTYGLRFQTPGVGVGYEYFFADGFAVMPSYTRVFPEVGRGSNFSFDLRYYVSESESQLYFIAGYSHNWLDSQPDSPGVTRKFVGANMGVGSYIRLTEKMGLSTELRFQSQNPRDVGLRIGLAFPL